MENDESDILFLPHLKHSALHLNLVYDVSNPRKVLGEPFPKGMTRNQTVALRLTPHPGLVCGNAYTGKVLWTNNNYTQAHWVSNEVLAQAQQKQGYQWSLLDGRTGKVLIKKLPYLENFGSDSINCVATAGAYLVMKATKFRQGEIACFLVRN